MTQYLMFMNQTYGRDEIDRLILLKNTIRKFSTIELQKIIVKYKELANAFRY